jgi:putative DNA methylase
VTNRRLIEEYLPIKTVGYESTREKLLRRRDYHISMLHLWWTRKPLAAARAAIYAALVPTPTEIDADNIDRFFSRLCAWDAAGGKTGIGSQSALDLARAEILAANDGKPPRVLDLFAGGGAIPLEATRLGCETTALELNPVAHLIELACLDYPQRYGMSLARDVEQWGTRLIDRAREEVGDLYPAFQDGSSQTSLDGGLSEGGRVPIGYLWTRTVPCPNPAERPHTVPLASQTWIVKKPKRSIASKPVVDRRSMQISFEVVEAQTASGLGFDPGAFSRRGSTTCPLCGASVTLGWVKQEAKAGRMSAQLMAVGVVQPGRRGKTYIGSDQAGCLIPDPAALRERLAHSIESGYAPPSTRIAAEDNQHFQAPMYGMATFGDLFSDRQMVLLLTLCRLVREIHDEALEEGVSEPLARAIATYLALLVDRVADRSTMLCHWHNTGEKTENTYARQALPMMWDFAETNPFGGSSGDLAAHLAGIIKVIEHCATTGEPVVAVRGSATELSFPDQSFDAVITDPPYYDNVSYADLSDFFYVWLQRSIGYLYPEHLAAEVTPKRSEAVVARYRHNGSRDAAKAAYESMMADAFAEAHRVLVPDGIMVCVYAHQTTAGWSTLIEAVRRAGFVVVEAWPLDTEMPTRGNAQGTASLASSIFLVARRRTQSATGDWAHDVRPELERIVEERVEILPKLGVSGTDLVIAAVGAGMRAYTRYPRVEKPNGEELAPEEYLDEVEREVSAAVLARIFGTTKQGIGRVDQPTQFYVMGRFEFGDAVGPWDELNTLARGTGVELAPLTQGPHALIKFGKNRSEARLRDYQERGEGDELGLDGARSTIDQLHRVLWLADHHPERMRDYLAIAQPDAERLRLVTQALARPGLSTGLRGREAEACERLLPLWRRLIENNLFTGEVA